MQPKLRVFVCNALIELVQPELARNIAATCTFLVSQIVSFSFEYFYESDSELCT